jgi:hypothetical protein
MVLMTARRQSILEDLSRRVGAGLLSGALAGFVGGIGARLAMRIVALAIHHFPTFTPVGTLLIILMGTVLGIVPGIVYAIACWRLPGHAIRKGVTYGIILLGLIGGYPLFIRASFPEDDSTRPWLVPLLFGALFLIYGLVLGMVEAIAGHRLSLPRWNWLRAIVQLLIALSSLGAAILFLATVASIEFDVHLLGT